LESKENQDVFISGGLLMSECKTCQGKSYYELPNYNLEIMERIECRSCLLDAQFKDNLMTDISKILSGRSVQHLAQIVAQLVVNGVDKNPSDDLSRLEGMIQTKQGLALMALAESYTNE
tara:strand:+ start:137 stop:493 length:357 start_codon:yes stop_codon:yes gene_type:complete